MIVHDYLTQRGGAERVVLSMLRTFPGAPLYTALYDADATFAEFADYDVRPLWTNKLWPLRKAHRCGVLMYPMVFSGLVVDSDFVLCSSSGFAHGVRTTGRKIVYCYTPPRWLYDQADTYLARLPSAVTAVFQLTMPALRRWDRWAAASADAYLTSSTIVRDRIHEAYGIDALIVPPPVTSITDPLERSVPGFVLCVSRLLAYKNVDAVIEAFESLPSHRLIVVGEGPERRRLQALAGSNVTLVGRVGDSALDWLYSNCAGLVSASYEDFGLTTVEAANHGKPSAVHRYGGFLDTVIEGRTGVFFEEPVAKEIARAIRKLVGQPWDAADIRCHGAAFSERAFSTRLREACSSAATI